MVCLTFDDGPGPDLTPRVLELLSKHDVPATFYLLGFRAEEAPRVADLVRAGGHEIGAHTMRHLHAWKHTPWACYRDVGQGYRTLAPWLSERARFRPPYGKLNIGSWAAVQRRSVPIDWWTVDSGDTWDKLPDPASVADRIVREQGGVVLLHDFDRAPNTGERADYVLRTADMIIRRARDSGLRFGTMSDLSGD
jgi:peptidoglycan/xylan/chitin deacetylase (PgdA/CDA1 family)